MSIRIQCCTSELEEALKQKYSFIKPMYTIMLNFPQFDDQENSLEINWRSINQN